MQKLYLNCMTTSISYVSENYHEVFGFFTTICPFHKSLVGQQAVRNCGFLQLNLQSRSPSDCYLFKNLKSHLYETRFADDESPKAVLKHCLKGRMDNSFFKA